MIYRQNVISEHFDSIENNLQNEFNTLGKVAKSKYICPTKNNPVMNTLLTDYRTQPNRASCFEDPSKKTEMPKEIKKILREDDNCLFRNTSDIYGEIAMNRTFYTTPNTMIPNKQNQFAEWLYGNLS